ncbi:hypothetical protein DDE01_11510 [Desulfovibrio desulfuricans]|nr:hypothetical protein DDE01_11510 [Desulfovibrio desulfuricans]
MDAVLREARDAASCVERERRVWEPLWREVEDFVLPRCIDSPRRADEAGDTARRGPRIIDGTATRAVRILAAGMQGGLTSPARPWFRLRLADEDMEEAGPERRWLDVVERRLYAALARSNFYAAVHPSLQRSESFDVFAVLSNPVPIYVPNAFPIGLNGTTLNTRSISACTPPSCFR